MLRLRVKLFHQRAAQFRGDGFQRVNRVVGVHGLHDIGGLLLRQLAEVLARVADIGEDVAKPLGAEQAIQPRALANVEQLECSTAASCSSVWPPERSRRASSLTRADMESDPALFSSIAIPYFFMYL